MREAFKVVTFYGKSKRIIVKANQILEEYNEQGFCVTLRQLYYQFVSRGLLVNNLRSYKNLGALISEARLAGLIDWDMIEDRTRVGRAPFEYPNLAACLDDARERHRLDRWQGQDVYAELWVEKDALAGVLEPLAGKFHVTLMVNKGYSSQSSMYESARRFKAEAPHKRKIIFYLGDHDPSGEDMVRDIRDRMEMFGAPVEEVRKLALTIDQIRQYDPPPNPVKLTDSRNKAYQEKFGDQCWEVDALPPDVLVKIISDAFEEVIDKPLMDAVIAREEADKKKILKVIDGWKPKKRKAKKKKKKPAKKRKPKKKKRTRKPRKGKPKHAAQAGDPSW